MIRRLASRPEILVPVVALGVMIVAFLCTPLINGHALTSFDFYNTLQGLAQLGLLTLGLGMTMIAGEFDLSVVGTYALGGMVAVRAGQSLARPRRAGGRGGGGGDRRAARRTHRPAAHPVACR